MSLKKKVEQVLEQKKNAEESRNVLKIKIDSLNTEIGSWKRQTESDKKSADILRRERDILNQEKGKTQDSEKTQRKEI